MTQTKLAAFEKFCKGITTTVERVYKEVMAFNSDTESEETLREKIDYSKRLEDLLDQKRYVFYEYASDENTKTFSENYFDNLETKLDQIRCNARIKLSAMARTKKEAVAGNAAQKPLSIKLPEIPLPKFDGKIDNWLYFKEQFLIVIGNHQTLSEPEKLFYLKSSIGEGLARDTQSADDTYTTLWTALCLKFDNIPLLVERHISSIFNAAKMANNSGEELEVLLNLVQKHLRALRTLNYELDDLAEQFLVFLVSTKIDFESLKAFKLQLKPNEAPQWEDFCKFLQSRCNILSHIRATKKSTSEEKQKPYKPTKTIKTEKSFNATQGSFEESSSYQSHQNSQHNSQQNPHQNTQQNSQQSSQQNSQSNSSQNSQRKSTRFCKLCNGSHYFNQCNSFKNLTIPEKITKINLIGACLRCFSYNHKVADCQKGHCTYCTQKHHWSLHPKLPISSNSAVTDLDLPLTKAVLLNTVIVLVQDNCGDWHQCRALLDPGAMSNFLTTSYSQFLKIPTKSTQVMISAITDSRSKPKCKAETSIKSKNGIFQSEIEFLVVDKITTNLPIRHFDISKWKIPEFCELSDPFFNKPSKIDMLIGMEFYEELITERRIELGQDLPILKETVFGWTVGGRMLVENNLAGIVEVSGVMSNEELSSQLKRFWEMETCSEPEEFTLEEQEVEEHFLKTYQRDDSGRFIVELPLKDNYTQLGDSEYMAEKRFEYLERKLNKSPELKAQYVEFMNEYEALGHMGIADNELLDEDFPSYYLPHHAVLRPDSSTTTCRVVFDGSAKSSSGLSINDVQKLGGRNQRKLFQIIIEFRTFIFVFTADMPKMYRQIMVILKHQCLQKIKWRSDPSKKLQTFKLKTVTYGEKAAPHLSTRCIVQLTIDEGKDFPQAAEAIRRGCFVDDVMYGADTLKKILELQRQVIEMLKLGQFDLHKWCANDPKILAIIPIESQEKKLTITEDGMTKALGITWQPKEDFFSFNFRFKPTSSPNITKRIIASDIATIFDPLGLVGPVILSLKCKLQEVWKMKVGWDDSLGVEWSQNWLQLREELVKLNELKIKRCVFPIGKSGVLNLHGFCDASIKGYGACLYVQTINSDGVSVSLLASKSHVAPIETKTIPQLELCSAVLLSHLTSSVIEAVQIKFNSINLWTDSTIALSWIKTDPGQFKIYVANRVKIVQRLTGRCKWRHIGTQNNPADVISRGLHPSEIQQCHIWWHGPQILLCHSSSWNSYQPLPLDQLPETVEPSYSSISLPSLDLFSRVSKYLRLLGSMAYVLRFIYYVKHKSHKYSGGLQPIEIDEALNKVLTMVQAEEFPEEISQLKESNQISHKSKLLTLSPVLEKGILKVGGRIENADCSESQKHPVILPPHHPFTVMLIRFYHQANLHAGPQLLLCILRQKYWIIHGKNAVKKVLKSCVRCYKANPKPHDQAMGQLPYHRLRPSHAFMNCGIDFFGPLYIKQHARSPVKVKAYGALFICLATKAIHLELVEDMSTPSFLNALHRLIGRRGRGLEIHSDNGTNFTGANNLMKELHSLFEKEEHQKSLSEFCIKESITWHFIPPRAPHFGGIWEAGVKSAKYHLKRILELAHLTFAEMYTILVRIEGILNSRPITQLSIDHNDPEPLTPSHFLIFRPISDIPEPNFNPEKLSYLQRWQRCSALVQDFWKRWRVEYLSELQNRQKWHKDVDVELEQVVLLKEDNVATLNWPVGRIIELFPGRDGKTRVVMVKTATGIYKRPVNRLCPLPISDNAYKSNFEPSMAGQSLRNLVVE